MPPRHLLGPFPLGHLVHVSFLRSLFVSYPLTTGSATNGPRVDFTLGDFKPPLLLFRGPHLGATAVLAREWLVNVIGFYNVSVVRGLLLEVRNDGVLFVARVPISVLMS